jgi:hypothetical protein
MRAVLRVALGEVPVGYAPRSALVLLARAGRAVAGPPPGDGLWWRLWVMEKLGCVC